MRIWSDMDDASEKPAKAPAAALWRALRPAMPAIIGAAALTFLFGAVMPSGWVMGISWNLYLDRLSELFVPPVGDAGRLALALGMAAVAALIAGLVALIAASPDAAGLGALRRRRRRGAADDALPRRRADLHPDAPPRPPIRAGRDLPALGLGPLPVGAETEAPAEPLPGEAAEADDTLILADLAPDDAFVEGAEPWLQPVEAAGPAMPDPADASLGAMVARFEAGLARRRQARGAPASTAAIPVETPPANEDAEPPVDFALEAALSTLQRMTGRAVG